MGETIQVLCRLLLPITPRPRKLRILEAGPWPFDFIHPGDDVFGDSSLWDVMQQALLRTRRSLEELGMLAVLADYLFESALAGSYLDFSPFTKLRCI